MMIIVNFIWKYVETHVALQRAHDAELKSCLQVQAHNPRTKIAGKQGVTDMCAKFISKSHISWFL